MMPKFIRETPVQNLDNTDTWYENTSYEDAKELVKENLFKTVSAFIAAGFWLKRIRDSRDYEMDGYLTLWECAESEFGLKVSEASRAMSMNDKYSVDGNSPVIQDAYKNYNKSQLQEMLTMSDEQMEQVTPDMSIKDIRAIKNPEPEIEETAIAELEESDTVIEDYEAESCTEAAGVSESAPCDIATDSVNTELEVSFSQDANKVIGQDNISFGIDMSTEESFTVELDPAELEEIMNQPDESVVDGEYREVEEDEEKLSAYGLYKTVYPAGSLINTKGCGNKYSCFMCAQKCDIRQEMLYCVDDAPLDNPFGCVIMDMLDDVAAEVGDKCQFINLDIAEHSAVNHIPIPCCKKCKIETCEYRCGKAIPDKNEAEKDIFKNVSESDDIDDYQLLVDMLEKEKDLLNQMIYAQKNKTLKEIIVRKQKIKVGALANMKCELEGSEMNNHDGWILSKDRLPQENEEVIACFEYGLIIIVDFFDKKFHGINGDYDEKVIIAWQPFPEPYHAPRQQEAGGEKCEETDGK